MQAFSCGTPSLSLKNYPLHVYEARALGAVSTCAILIRTTTCCPIDVVSGDIYLRVSDFEVCGMDTEKAPGQSRILAG